MNSSSVDQERGLHGNMSQAPAISLRVISSLKIKKENNIYLIYIHLYKKKEKSLKFDLCLTVFLLRFERQQHVSGSSP